MKKTSINSLKNKKSTINNIDLTNIPFKESKKKEKKK